VAARLAAEQGFGARVLADVAGGDEPGRGEGIEDFLPGLAASGRGRLVAEQVGIARLGFPVRPVFIAGLVLFAVGIGAGRLEASVIVQGAE